MPGPPHVALLLNNPFVTDSRALKIARTAATAGYRVTVVAREGPGLPPRETDGSIQVVRVAQPSPPRWLPTPGLPAGEDEAGPLRRIINTVGRAGQAVRYLWIARGWARAIGRQVSDADVWQSEGLVTLPVALALRRRFGGRVVYDSRDIHVESARFARLPGPWRRLLQRRERAWVAAADGLITVSEPYATVLERTLGRRATIVMNGPPTFDPPEPPERRLSVRLGLDPSTPIVLYLGQLTVNRGVEELCDAIEEIPGAVLVVVGFGAEAERYRRRAAALPHADRIHFLPGVAPDEILPIIASADVSAMPVQASTLNHRLNTPTKLFDAMGAGTPVVASDLPGMAPIVRATGCGVLCDPADPHDIARAIRTILEASPERRRAYRDACRAAALGAYSWARQEAALLGLYRDLGVPPPVDR